MIYTVVTVKSITGELVVKKLDDKRSLTQYIKDKGVERVPINPEIDILDPSQHIHTDEWANKHLIFKGIPLGLQATYHISD